MQTALVVPRPRVTPRVGVEAFFRRKRAFFWTVTITLFATVLVTIFTPRRYASEMKFLVQNTRGNVVVTSERTNSAGAANDVTETQVNSELEILHSHDVVDPIADPEWAKSSADQRTPRIIRRHQKLLTAFEKRFSTETVRKTNIINVSLLADTPANAKSELEGLSAAYLAVHRRLQRPNGASGFFALEAERIRKDWDTASQKLVHFQREHQVLSLANREAELQTQITEHERDLLATDAMLLETGAKLSAKATDSKQDSSTNRELVKRSGNEAYYVKFGTVQSCLKAVLEALGGRRVWLLLDEWSEIPLDIQPYLADLLRRCVVPLAGITLKVAAIEHRSNMSLRRQGEYTVSN